MCFAPKIPDPKPAPNPPSAMQANEVAIQEQRSQATRASAARNILTRLKDEDVAGSAMKRKLGQ